jgi:hypothetical protein
MTIRTKPSAYTTGYEHGLQAAIKYINSVRSRQARRDPIPPSDLAHTLGSILKRMDALGGWTITERPVAEHSPEQQAILGEFFGFCGGLLKALQS